MNTKENAAGISNLAHRKRRDAGKKSPATEYTVSEESTTSSSTVEARRSFTDRPARFIRIKEVENLTGISHSTIYKKIGEGTFPAQIKLGTRVAVWVDETIQNWIRERASSSQILAGEK